MIHFVTGDRIVTVYTMANHSADSSWASTVMESKHMPHRRRRFPMGICGYVHRVPVNRNHCQVVLYIQAICLSARLLKTIILLHAPGFYHLFT